jgi:hypothetical protein
LDVNDPTTCGSAPAGSADFSFFGDGTCSKLASIPPAQSPNPQTGVVLDVSGGPGAGDAESGYTSNLSVASYSYSAHFNSTNPNFNSITSSCEPLNVVSSISDLHYNITNGGNYGNPSGPWSCRQLDAKTVPPGSAPEPATCPNSEGIVQLSSKTNRQINNYLVTLAATNNTGGSINENIKGGLIGGAQYADSSGNPYTPVGGVITVKPSDITTGCGVAKITVSTTTSPSTVYWNQTGASVTKPSAGFSMAQGQVCQLKVMELKEYRALGDQALTSTFNECQLGPSGSYSFSAISPSSGKLLVKVKP